MERLREIWFVDWWLQTQNWGAKMLVIQAVGAKVASIIAVLCLLYLGAWVVDTACQILPFRVWSSQSVTKNLTLWHACAIALLAASILVMGKCNV